LTAPVDEQRRRVESFYDEWTDRFVAGFGTTFQAGFVKRNPGDPEDPAISALLLAERAGIRDGTRVLDAGCGVGGPAVAVARQHAQTQWCCATVSAVQAARARRFVSEAGLAGRIGVVRADYHHLPVADASFDTVLFLESCGYSPDRRSLFAEAARVVRPGGHVYVKDVFARPGPLSPAEAHDLAAFDSLWRLASSPTLPEVCAALVGAGCEILAAGALEVVGTDRFVAAMAEPDPVTVLRLSELGRSFLLSAPACPTFFGEVLARRPVHQPGPA
jgi:cyclopropane fatty-acyl-phospholipid synthase-like methyltransferase